MRISKKAILAELEALYPDAKPELNFRNPYETLVAVMLSAQCTDKQVNKVTPALFDRYPTVAAMAAASVDDVIYDTVDARLTAKMHKAIAVIQCKLEGQLL